MAPDGQPEGDKKSTLRLFVATPLPPALRSSIRDLRDELKRDGEKVRWVPIDNIHLTLKFFGNLEGDEDTLVGTIKGALERGVRDIRPFNIYVDKVGAFPNRRHPRVLHLGIKESEHLRDLKIRIDGELAVEGYEEEKGKTFRPHLTLCRVKDKGDGRALGRRVESLERGYLESLHIKGAPIKVTSLLLFKSTLNSTGAEYTPLEEVLFD